MIKRVSTAKEARQWVGEAIGQTNTDEQLKIMNRIRQWFYANREDLGVEVALTFQLNLEEFFHGSCSYMGFRLPSGYSSLQAVKVDEVPVSTHSEWRTPYDGVSGTSANGVSIFDRGEFGLQRDLQEEGAIELVAQETSVASQTIEIIGQLVSGEYARVEYQVGKDATVTEQIWTHVERVSCAEGVDGVILLKDSKGNRLLKMDGGIKNPVFRGYEVRSIRERICSIVVTANRRYEDITDDRDLVEFGGDLLWNMLAKVIDMVRKSDMNGNDRANLELLQSQAVLLMQQASGAEQGESMGYKFQRKRVSSVQLFN